MVVRVEAVGIDEGNHRVGSRLPPPVGMALASLHGWRVASVARREWIAGVPHGGWLRQQSCKLFFSVGSVLVVVVVGWEI